MPPKKGILTKGSHASGTLTKGKGAASKKPSTKVMKVKKLSLKKGHLEKLGKMTLAQKVQKAAEGCETAQEAATNLRGMLTKEEHSKVWSKHNVALKKKPAKEQKAFDSLTKGEKGMEAAMYMVKASVPQFMQVKESVGQDQTLDKREERQSEKELIAKFGQDEFERHVQSGRLQWREDPWTWGVYNYKDKGNIVKSTKVRKSREWSKGQEFEPTEEDEERWNQWWEKDHSNHLHLAENWGKGGGKAKNALTKGKGKGKGKPRQLALTNGPSEEEEEICEEEQWAKLMTKAKRARDQCNSAIADCEAAMEAAHKAKRLTKQARKDTESMLDNLKNTTKVLKDVLAKKDRAMPLGKATDLLVEAGFLIKEIKEESKELNQLANKAGSKTSKK